MTLRGMVLAAALLAVAATVGLGGETLAVSNDKTFRLYLTDADFYALTNAEDIATWKVTWRDGEAVEATAMDGTAYTVADGTGNASSAVLPGERGGLWTFENSVQGKAAVSVPWALYQGAGIALVTAGGVGWRLATDQAGPDRKVMKNTPIPPVAYSGDDWSGDVSLASALAFTSPSGNTTTVETAGYGSHAFTFDETGVWTVVLSFADGASKTACINVTRKGMTILFR